MTTVSNLVDKRIKEAVADEIARLTEIIVGPNISDHAYYKYIIGQVHGLHVALELMDMVAKDLEQELRS